MVDIITQSPGLSAEEIERYITMPVEVGVATSPFLSAMRTISLFGLSDVKLQFTYDLTYEEAEQKVLNRLSQLPALANGAQLLGRCDDLVAHVLILLVMQQRAECYRAKAAALELW